ncbi:hypothetical protein [Hoeflea ulvae]|uniref:DUF5343 domain-containing protein n=1 Tax=Hoeflea ulvae TaxID=2983764 RepID=A0ABT3Y9U1_9HYPH|nr:hypothetical protein [Hoeflea ulvae]MCY0092638.1 hypothetical protein [Hoeflea ulvae]
MKIKQRVRSPRYPAISLQEAEEMVRRIFEKDGMNPVDRESAVQHMGYSSLNGASATALASLKQFGLTSDAGKGMLQLTTLALDLIEPESEEGRAKAIQAAAFTPDLFSSLRQRFPETVPSEGNLRAHLLRQEFTSAAVKSVVPAYLQTCEYVAAAGESEETRNDDIVESESPRSEKQEADRMSQNAPQDYVQQANTSAPGQVKRMVFDALEGEVMFTYPDNLSEESVQELEEWFALVAKRLRRATKH